MDDRRLDAIRREEERAKKTARDQTAQISPEQKFQVLTEEAITNATLNLYMTLVSVYRANMRAVSKLLVAISTTLGIFLLIAFVVYVIGLQTTGELAGVLPRLAYSVTLGSPIVAVGDAILMTYYLTKDVAGRSLEEQLRDVGGEQARATEAVRKIPLWEWLLQSAIVPLIPLVTLMIFFLYFKDGWVFAVAAFGSILIGDFLNSVLKRIERSIVRRSFALFRYAVVLTVFSLFAAQAGALLQNAVKPPYKSYFLGLLTVVEATVLVSILVFVDVAIQHKEFLPNDERTKKIRERLRHALCLRKPPQQKVGPTQRD